jgi:predicted DNA binding CopG/RHH family protein
MVEKKAKLSSRRKPDAVPAAPEPALSQSSTEEAPTAEARPAPTELELEKAEKAVKLKRLTLDIPKPLHKAIKAQAVEEGIPMVDMLRTLLERHYHKQ